MKLLFQVSNGSLNKISLVINVCLGRQTNIVCFCNCSVPAVMHVSYFLYGKVGIIFSLRFAVPSVGWSTPSVSAPPVTYVTVERWRIQSSIPG